MDHLQVKNDQFPHIGDSISFKQPADSVDQNDSYHKKLENDILKLERELVYEQSLNKELQDKLEDLESFRKSVRRKSEKLLTEKNDKIKKLENELLLPEQQNLDKICGVLERTPTNLINPEKQTPNMRSRM